MQEQVLNEIYETCSDSSSDNTTGVECVSGGTDIKLFVFEAKPCNDFVTVINRAINEYQPWVARMRRSKNVAGSVLDCAAATGFLRLSNGVKCEEGIAYVNALVNRHLENPQEIGPSCELTTLTTSPTTTTTATTTPTTSQTTTTTPTTTLTTTTTPTFTALRGRFQCNDLDDLGDGSVEYVITERGESCEVQAATLNSFLRDCADNIGDNGAEDGNVASNFVPLVCTQPESNAANPYTVLVRTCTVHAVALH